MIGLIIQARMGSQRLPGKVLKKIDKKYLLDLVVERAIQSKKIDKLIICTTNSNLDKKIVNYCKKKHINFFCGSENDLIKRYIQTAERFKIKTIVRITADCPLIDPLLIDILINYFKKLKVDYCSNTCPPNISKFPDGSDVEIFSLKTLKEISLIENRKDYREHLTKFYWNENKYKIFTLKNKINWSNYKFSIDTQKDFNLLKMICNHFGNQILKVTTAEIINFLKDSKDYEKYN